MQNSLNDLRKRFIKLQNRIAEAEQRFGRVPGSVRLVAVTKTWPADMVRTAAALGQRDFGENYVQEALDKIKQLHDLALEWHFIGRVQSNKAKAIATHFAWVHSVARLEQAQQLAQFRPAELTPLNVCIQVNIASESSKAGVEVHQVAPLAAEIVKLPRLRLRGLMALPGVETDIDTQRATFRRVHKLFDQLRDGGMALDTLSMGMSDDLEAAIAEGATIVRIGTALFGQRQS